MSVQYEIKWRKGSYLAKIDGPAEKWGLARTFDNTGVAIKSRGGVLQYQLDPGFYEYREGHKGNPKQYISVDALGSHDFPETSIGALDVISAGPTPDAPGTWNDMRCRCGADVDSYGDVGFPHCDQCTAWEDLTEAEQGTHLAFGTKVEATT